MVRYTVFFMVALVNTVRTIFWYERVPLVTALARDMRVFCVAPNVELSMLFVFYGYNVVSTMKYQLSITRRRA